MVLTPRCHTARATPSHLDASVPTRTRSGEKETTARLPADGKLSAPARPTPVRTHTRSSVAADFNISKLEAHARGDPK